MMAVIISDGRWEKRGGGSFPQMMPHKEMFQLLRYLVPGALDLPELLWAAALVWVVYAGGMSIGTVDLLEV